MRLVVFIASFCFLAATASASYYYGDYKKYNTRNETQPGMKCAGAPGYPYVQYAPCTKGYSCMEKKKYEKGEWGLYCLPSNQKPDKCYKENERCKGAPGKPYVPYYPCCNSSLVCVEQPSMGYGSFCLKHSGHKPGYPTTTGPASTSAPGSTRKHYYYTKTNRVTTTSASTRSSPGKCYHTGYRCSGYGYSYGHNHGHCCDAKDECRPYYKYGWARYCLPKKTHPVQPTTAPTTTRTPSTRPRHPYKCVRSGYPGCTPHAKGYRGAYSCCKADDECISDPSKFKGKFYCYSPVQPAPTPEAYKYYY